MEHIALISEAVDSNLKVGPAVSQAIAWIGLLLFAWVSIRLIQVLFGFGGSKSRRGDALLLLGQCGAGKTALFYSLRDPDDKVNLVSSQKVNRDKLSVQGKVIDTIDFPGHLRLRSKCREVIKEARCIVYLVDLEDKPMMKDVAEHLYELFTHPDVLHLHTPILLAFNKSDAPGARTDKFVVSELEREIEAMRLSRGATLEGQDQVDSYLGVDGEKFRLEQAPCPLETCRISVKKPDLDPVLNFINVHFG